MQVQITSAILITDGAIVFPTDEGKDMNRPQVPIPFSFFDIVFQILTPFPTCDTPHLRNGRGQGSPTHHGSEAGEARP